MEKSKIINYYRALLQVSFELYKYLEPDSAEHILDELCKTLFTEDGEIGQKQINDALRVIKPFPLIRERVRQLMNGVSLGSSSSLEFYDTPGEPLYAEKSESGRWLICPIDGERIWDYEISSGERRLCLKHGVYFKILIANIERPEDNRLKND